MYFTTPANQLATSPSWSFSPDLSGMGTVVDFDLSTDLLPAGQTYIFTWSAAPAPSPQETVPTVPQAPLSVTGFFAIKVGGMRRRLEALPKQQQRLRG